MANTGDEDQNLREQCAKILRRAFPDTNSVDCTTDDVLNLLAIFERDRLSTYDNTPALPEVTRYHAVDKVVLSAPFIHYRKETAVLDFRRYLSLLSIAFLSIKPGSSSIQHERRNRWYEGINNLHGHAQTTRRACPMERMIDSWDVAFLLKHCQYLLIGTEDSVTGLDRVTKVTFGVAVGALQAYEGRYDEARKTALAVAHSKRRREKWHDTYLNLEAKCFNIYARSQTATNRNVGEYDELKKMELQTTIEVRNELERELLIGGSKYSKGKELLRRGVGRLGKTLLSAGPYEENPDYFKYGLLDLLYQLTCRITNREHCFLEMIGAVSSVLESSHKSANLLHCKAIELYHRIKALGQQDGLSYGDEAKRCYIEQWEAKHKGQVGTSSISEAYASRRINEANWKAELTV